MDSLKVINSLKDEEILLKSKLLEEKQNEM